MYDKVKEKIQVKAEFPGSTIIVKEFTWKEKTYEIDKVNLIVKARKGREVVWLFNVSTKNAAFKLRFDTESLQWFIVELTWEETHNH